MKRYITLFYIFISTVSVLAQMGQASKAMKKLEKNDIEKMSVLIEKSMDKDSLYPAALYAKSHLFLQSSPMIYNLDSAYCYILLALESLKNLDEKELQKHFKKGFDKHVFKSHKERIDSLAFTEAVEINTEEYFNSFLARFKSASQVPQAIELRNQLAFNTAKKINTYQSYKGFIDKYPEAKHVAEAKKRYEKLYFDKNTADGKLQSYEKFLKRHPETPYRREAEEKIFQIMTADGRGDNFSSFLKKYPSSFLKGKALSYLYHLLKEEKKALPNQFLTDSLKRVNGLEAFNLLPFYEDEKYGFMNLTGQVIIESKYKSINPDYLCSLISDDFLQVNGAIVGRNGALIYRYGYDEARDIGFGLIEIKSQNQYGVIHKSGLEVLKIDYDQIGLITSFIVAEKSNKWALFTLTGIQLTNFEFDDILAVGDYLLFEKQNKYDVKKTEELARSANRETLYFKYLFDDYELLRDGNLWLKSDYGEMIMSQDLSEVVKYKKHRIEFIDIGFLIDDKGTSVLLNDKYAPLTDKAWHNTTYNKSWFKYSTTEGNGLFSIEKQKEISLTKDSLALKGEYFVFKYTKDSVSVFFRSAFTKTFPIAHNIRILANGNSNQYLIVTDDKGTSVYNSFGTLLTKEKLENLQPLSEEYLTFNKEDKKGLLSGVSGKILLKAEYDAIGNYDNGRVSLLKDQRFGSFSLKDSISIPTEYTRSVQPYNSKILMVYKDGLLGFVDKQNTQLSDIIFEKIEFWNDSAAMVKQGPHWKIYDLVNKQIVYDRIKSYHKAGENGLEVYYIILVENNYGVLSNKRGEIIPPTFNDVLNVGSSKEPVFFTEKHIEEAGFYVVIYYNTRGEIVRKQAFEGKDYDKIYCTN